jgi:PAS domain-containing protein
MLDKAHQDAQWSGKGISIPRLTETGDVSTQTIDLSNLFSGDVHETASFDLRAIESSSLGNLLNALPMPAFVIDSYYCVAFANQACRKITHDADQIRGLRFADLLPYPSDQGKAQALVDKAQALLERAFQTRKPQRAEAILEMAGNKLWCRLHIRSVRLTAERYLLVLIEDVTNERAEQRIRQREEQRLRKAYEDMGTLLKKRTAELHESDARLKQESANIERAKEVVLREKKKFQALFRAVPVGMMSIGSDGSVRDANPKLLEMFGCVPDDLPLSPEWLTETFPNGLVEGSSGSGWAETLSALASKDSDSLPVSAVTKEGTHMQVKLGCLQVGRGDFVVICEDVSGDSDERHVA